jgi:hypothetical protein
MKRHIIGGGILAGVGALVLALTLGTWPGSPRSYIQGRYSPVGAAAGAHAVYQSPKAPTLVANEIAKAHRPQDQAFDPAGVFLRYNDDMIAVTPSGTGSRIEIDDSERGYRAWYPYIGPRWGGPGGRSALFRGGGPGAGK